jgi:sporulation protein YlmC with PRC-barrel domain
MTDEATSQSARSMEATAANVDPRSYLKPQMRVVGEQGKALGKVDEIEHDAAGQVTSITVRHGLLKKTSTRIDAVQIKQVNQDSVMVKYSPSAFKRLAKSASS